MFFDRNVMSFIGFCSSKWKGWKIDKPDSIILIDVFCSSQYILISSYFANILARKHNARIVGVAGSRLFALALCRIYRAFNATRILFPRNSRRQGIVSLECARTLWKQIESKQDLLDFEYKGIEIGIDVYESYLRVHSMPTVDLDDSKLFKLFSQSIELIDFWSDYFTRNRVSAVIVSHDCYLHFNALVKVAYSNDVPVYLPNLIYPTYSNRPFTFYSFMQDYHKFFAMLGKEDQENGLQIGRELLENRIWKGRSELSDLPTVNFQLDFKPHRIIRESSKFKIMICSHCFYDNPHAYSKLLFADFYEWLEYLGKLSLACDYDWYIKVHLDPLPETMKVIEGYLQRYPHIELVPMDANPHQLAAEGLDFVTTVFGSVAHEYPALGIQVINAGYNPTFAYGFNWHATTLDEYENMLSNLSSLSKNIDLEEMYEFYYVHYRLCKVDDLILSSYQEYSQSAPGDSLDSSDLYPYFLDCINDEIHHKIVGRISHFIDTKHNHMFETELFNKSGTIKP